jgi:hypothetical protein
MLLGRRWQERSGHQGSGHRWWWQWETEIHSKLISQSKNYCFSIKECEGYPENKNCRSTSHVFKIIFTAGLTMATLSVYFLVTSMWRLLQIFSTHELLYAHCWFGIYCWCTLNYASFFYRTELCFSASICFLVAVGCILNTSFSLLNCW